MFLTGHYIADGDDHVATNQLFTDNVIQNHVYDQQQLDLDPHFPLGE